MSEGKRDEMVGRVKKAAGALTNDGELEREGQKDQAAGRLKRKAGELVDRLRNALDGNRDSSEDDGNPPEGA